MVTRGFLLKIPTISKKKSLMFTKCNEININKMAKKSSLRKRWILGIAVESENQCLILLAEL